MAKREVYVPRRDLPPRVRALYPFNSYATRLPPDARGLALEMRHVEAGEGEPVLLVHGNPTWSFLYRDFLAPLAAEGFRAMAPDHVGCGLSDHPTDPAYYSVARHVGNLTAWADAQRLAGITLVVHDWGGPIGLGFAVARPELVKRIVVLDTVVRAPSKPQRLTAWHALFGGALGKPLGQDLNLILETAMRFGVVNRRKMRGAVLEGYKWPFPTSTSRVAPRRFVAMVPTGPDHPEAATLRGISTGLAKLADKPAIVVWGEKDLVLRVSYAEKWRAQLPGVRRVVRLPNAGHFLQEDAPEAIVREIVRLARETP